MMKSIVVLIFTLICCGVNAQQMNFDESKVKPYTLPEVLRTTSGKTVKKSSEWEKERRPEILDLFEEHVYGRMPKSYDSIRYKLINEDARAMDGKAKLKEVAINIYKCGQVVQINLVMFVPNGQKKRPPVFLLICNRGKENIDPTRKIKSGFWPAEQIVEGGYAAAAFYVGDLAPDDKDKFVDGTLKLYPEQLTMNDGMRTIGAWAWGASRVMDYLQQDKDINKKRVAVVGHSRGGKTSLWACAQDQRFAMCMTNNSGNTGAALTRRKFGETVAAINTSFPHWFNNNYKKYNNNEDALPVDQHMLISLIAPRPVYVTSASKDAWTDPKGTFLAMKNAEPVYSLYKINSRLPTEPPAINHAIVSSRLGYHIREGEHDLTPFDWANFMKFANYNYKIIAKQH